MAEEDVYLSGSREKVEEREEAADKEAARALDQASSASEREAKLALEERLEDQDRRLAELTKALRAQGKPVGNLALAGNGHALSDAVGKMLEGKKVVQIMLHSDPSNLASNYDVNVSINGKTWTLPRGVPVEVPVEVVEVLVHAEVQGVQRIVDAEGYPHAQRITYQRFPFTIIG
jgi:hypothetical protein